MEKTRSGALTGSVGECGPLSIAYIFEIHPVLSQTPLEREVAGLTAQGLTVTVHSLLRRKLKVPDAPAEIDRARVDYFRWWEAARLIEALPREWRRDPALLRDGWQMLRRHRPVGLTNFFVNFWAAIFAVCRAEKFRASGVQHVHGAWASGPATAAAILGRLCGIPFSFAAHAYDIYDHGGDQFLEPKLRAASFVRTITEANLAHLRQVVPQANIPLIRMGLRQLPPPVRRISVSQPIRLLSVARLVPKKGLFHQLAACRLLKQWGLSVETRIVGDGELRRHLQRQINVLELNGVVTLCGEQQQEQVQEAYRWADIFWHTGVVDAHGNRDGLPNVIPEAFAHQLPVICCREPGPTEAVTHEVTGLVVDVTDPVALAAAVRRLVEDEPLRRRLAENARRWVEENFLVSKNITLLAQAFRETTLRRETRAQLAADAELALAARRLAGNVPVVKAPPTIAYILMKYPSLSQTFLEREIVELTRQGLQVEVHSLWRARLDTPSPKDAFNNLTIHYFHWWEAARLIIALPRELRRDPELLRDGRRIVTRYSRTTWTDFLKNLWGATFAVCRARQFREHRVQLVHGAWAASPATAAAILGRLCGIPFSFGAQAYDIYEHGGDQFLESKLRAACFVHTTTQANVAHLRRRAPQANVILARRGLDRLPPIVRRDRTSGPIRILSVARLVPIKGHDHQLAACALLKQWRIPFEARLVGDGESKHELQKKIESLGLAGFVTLCGGQQHEQVQETYRWADIFWHTGVIDAHGNRDGLPNVIPEAFAHQLPVICCREPGATEAVTNEVTGLVVDVADAVALATAVRRLVEDEPLRRRLGENGRRWVEENFLVSKNVAVLAQAVREAAGNHVAELPSAGAATPTIVYIFEHHPGLAQTFLKREITELMRQGLRVEIHSLWRTRLGVPSSEPGASAFPEYDQLTIHYFHWWEAARLIVAWPREWRRDPTLLRDGWRVLRRYRPTSLGNLIVNVWAVVFAVCRAREFRQTKPNLVHGVWATGPATAAAILSRLCGVPFSFGTDGYDVYDRGGDQFLEPKLHAASFIQANFQANVVHLRQRVPQANVILARRGLERLPSVAKNARAPGPIRILSVARLVPKKGLFHQLAACALLKQWGVSFEARIIGRGPLHRQLRRQIDALGLADAVSLCGGQQHERVQETYRWADIFWHTGIVDAHGNRDGLPNVIPEAFAYRLPVISGNVPGATDAVIHEVTGLVVDVADHRALATAARRLIEDESLRRRLGENGRRWVAENFLVSKNAGILAESFRSAVCARSRPANPVSQITMTRPAPV